MSRLNELLPERGAVPEHLAKAPPPAEPELAPDVCPECRGAGFVRLEVPLDHPDFGKAVQCRCVEAESREERLERLQRYSNLGPLTRLTFESLNPKGLSHHAQDRRRFERCVEDAKLFAKDPEGWLVILGASGRGKTHVAAAIANRCIERGHPALFVVVPDILDHLRAAYRPDAEVRYDQLFEQVRNAPVLVLDDLGAHSSTAWAEEKLFQIINHRYNHRMATVFTSNVPLRKVDERLRTRLTDTTLAKVYEIGQRTVLEYQDINILFQKRFQAMTFDNFDTNGYGLQDQERESLATSRSACLRFAASPDGWIVLTGSPGCGKTHLAAAIANYRLREGEVPLVVKASRLLQLLRSTFGEDAELSADDVLEEVENAPLLVLDDLFFRQSRAWKSEWANEQLFEIVDHRYENRLPTIFTTALTEAAMHSDEIGNRFAARLWDYGISLELQIKAPAYKSPAAPSTKAGATSRSQDLADAAERLHRAG